MDNQSRCFGEGRGYDPSTGLCVTGQSDGGVTNYTYYVPGQTASTSPPLVASNPGQFVWPGAIPRQPAAIKPVPVYTTSPVITPTNSGTDFVGAILSFLQIPGPLGIPYWGIGAGLVVAYFVFAGSGTGGKKKAAGGWL